MVVVVIGCPVCSDEFPQCLWSGPSTEVRLWVPSAPLRRVDHGVLPYSCGTSSPPPTPLGLGKAKSYNTVYQLDNPLSSKSCITFVHIPKLDARRQPNGLLVFSAGSRGCSGLEREAAVGNNRVSLRNKEPPPRDGGSLFWSCLRACLFLTEGLCSG